MPSVPLVIQNGHEASTANRMLMVLHAAELLWRKMLESVDYQATPNTEHQSSTADNTTRYTATLARTARATRSRLHCPQMRLHPCIYRMHGINVHFGDLSYQGFTGTVQIPCKNKASKATLHPNLPICRVKFAQQLNAQLHVKLRNHGSKHRHKQHQVKSSSTARLAIVPEAGTMHCKKSNKVLQLLPFS